MVSGENVKNVGSARNNEYSRWYVIPNNVDKSVNRWKRYASTPKDSRSELAEP
jgi:hypothetical protein